jgi:hypothetical protein
MSILDALKTQTNSIDELAALPQAMIMQMAQKGQIRQDMLAPILGRKAEMAEAVARTRALQGQGGQQPTVMEQIMSRNAQAEAPMPEAREMGVAQLPVREDMFNEQRMAGGGIVAFDRGGDVNQMSDQERADYIKNNEYLQRSQALRNIPLGFADFIQEYNPITGSKFREGVASFFTKSPEEQAVGFRKASDARDGKRGMFSSSEEEKKKDEQALALAKAEADLRRKTEEAKSKQQKTTYKFDPAVIDAEEAELGKALAKNNKPAVNVTTKEKEKPKPAETVKEDGLSKYEKMLMEAGESSKAAREDAKYMRLLEAGLNIMGGESPYAFANIGKGAAAAAKGYGEDVRGFRKEDRERIKDLMEIQKERADAEYKAKLLRVQELAATKPSGIAELAQLYRTNPELARLVQGQGKAGIMTFEEAYKIVAADLKNASLSETEKAQKARDLMAMSAGGGTSAPAVLNYVPGQKLK